MRRRNYGAAGNRKRFIMTGGNDLLENGLVGSERLMRITGVSINSN